MLQLKVDSGKEQGRTLDLQDGVHVIGRSRQCSLCIRSDSKVSRVHCQIQVVAGQAVLSNRSENKTYVIGIGPIDREFVLKDGHVIQLGYSDTKFSVHELKQELPEIPDSSEPVTGFLSTSFFHQEVAAFNDGTPTREAPVVVETICKRFLFIQWYIRVLLLVSLVIFFIVGAILIWWL